VVEDAPAPPDIRANVGRLMELAMVHLHGDLSGDVPTSPISLDWPRAISGRRGKGAMAARAGAVSGCGAGPALTMPSTRPR
jgi:hypothetical protein